MEPDRSPEDAEVRKKSDQEIKMENFDLRFISRDF